MSKTSKHFPIWPLLLLGVLLIVGWLGVRLWRITQATQSLLDHQREIEQLAETGLNNLNPDTAEQLLLDIRQDIVTIKTEIEPLLPLAPALAWLPEVGPLAANAKPLLDMADAGTEAAAYAARGLKPGFTLLQDESIPGEARLPLLVQVIDDAEPDLHQAGVALAQVAQAREQIEDMETLPWRLQTLLQEADTWLPLAQDGLQLAPVLPSILGFDGPKRYLILAQNEDELRPTGGFITGAGIVLVDNGRIADLTFQDANNVDNWQDKPYDFPPQPLYDYMGLELFLFRDANYWPDFPTSAEVAMDLYSYGQDEPPLDGLIAIDQEFLKLLMQAIGPIQIEEEDLRLTAKNIIDNMHLAWSNQDEQRTRDWISSRKDFLGIFAGAIQQKLEEEFDTIDPLRLSQNMYAAIKTKHLQIYMRDPATATILNNLNWDGRLQYPGQSDTLMIVDTNVSYSKSNYYVRNAIAYHVTLAANGGGKAQLIIDYTHTGPTTDACEPGAYYYADSPAYLDGADKCYWNYLRVYTPPGSQLLDATSHIVPNELVFTGRGWNSPAHMVNDTLDFTTFANFFLLEKGQQLQTQFTYQLPTLITQSGAYHLHLYRQAGVRPQPIEVIVTLPPDTSLLKAVPTPTTVDGATVRFELTLTEDTDITVHYQQE